MSLKGTTIEAVEDHCNETGLLEGTYVINSEEWMADSRYNSFAFASDAKESSDSWIVEKSWVDNGFVRVLPPMSTIQLIEQWADNRNLIEGSDPKSQFVKLVEEVGELANDIAKGKDVKDSIGDVAVVLAIIAKQYGTTLDACLELAYNEIKDRKGKMVDGVFVKEVV